jgi:hypothetical protein
MRIITGKTNTVTKGSAEVTESVSCHVVLAQLR